MEQMEGSYSNSNWTGYEGPQDMHVPMHLHMEGEQLLNEDQDGEEDLEDHEESIASGTPAAAHNERIKSKKRIRRIRPLRSCLSCNRRKIKCDREDGGCGPCKKRGEGESCSLVAGLTSAQLTNVVIAERLSQLEARVEELESAASSPAAAAAGGSSSTINVKAASSLSPAASTQSKATPLAQPHLRRSSGSGSLQAILSHNSASTSILQSDAHGHPATLRPDIFNSFLSSSDPTPTSMTTNPDSGNSLLNPTNVSRTINMGGGDALLSPHSQQPDTIKASEKASLTNFASCETEEAALALESLCGTGDVGYARNLTMIGAGNGIGGIAASSISRRGSAQGTVSVTLPTAKLSNAGLPGSMFPNNHARHVTPPIAASSDPLHSSSSRRDDNTISNTPLIWSLTPEERSRRSTILVDPTLDANTARGQRSLAVRKRILCTTSSSFPSKELCDHIVWSYFRHMDPLWHVHIGWLFDNEYKQFWKLRNEGRFAEVDPAWGALLFMTLALGLQVTELPLPPSILPFPTATSLDVLALADSYICDVEELLVAANWARIPQLRVLQSLALFSGFQTMMSLSDPSTFTLNGAGVRIAQILGLNQLGSIKDASSISAKFGDDVAVPTGNEALKDHLARIIWHTLVVMELVQATRVGLAVPAATTPYTTDLPSNIDDVDLQDTAPGPVIEKPAWILTSVSSLHLRALITRMDKKLLDLPETMKATEKYTQVMNIDAELRKWIAASPTRQTGQQDYAAYKLSQWQHWSLMADVYGAIIHLHRPYMTRGYVDQRFSFSTKTCLESAKILCESWQHLRDYVTDQRFWWSSMRYLSAALVIFIDLFMAMDDGCLDEVLAAKRADIPLVCSILQERMQSIYQTTSNFAAAAYGVVTNLLEAEKVKRAAISERRNSIDGRGVQESEPVGRVFKRIAQNLSAPSGMHSESFSGSSNATPTVYSSPQDGTSSTEPKSIVNTAEDPIFAQVPAAKRPHKQVKRVSGIADDERSAKAPKRSPTDSRLPSLSAPTVVSDGFTRPASTPLSHQPTVFTNPAANLPNLSSGSNVDYQAGMNSYAMWQSDEYLDDSSLLQTQRHDSFSYPSAGTASNLLDSGYGQMFAQESQPPITWDTSGLFHPDPSVLMHSIGFSTPSHHHGETVFNSLGMSKLQTTLVGSQDFGHSEPTSSAPLHDHVDSRQSLRPPHHSSHGKSLAGPATTQPWFQDVTSYQ